MYNIYNIIYNIYIKGKKKILFQQLALKQEIGLD